MSPPLSFRSSLRAGRLVRRLSLGWAACKACGSRCAACLRIPRLQRRKRSAGLGSLCAVTFPQSNSFPEWPSSLLSTLAVWVPARCAPPPPRFGCGLQPDQPGMTVSCKRQPAAEPGGGLLHDARPKRLCGANVGNLTLLFVPGIYFDLPANQQVRGLQVRWRSAFRRGSQ